MSADVSSPLTTPSLAVIRAKFATIPDGFARLSLVPVDVVPSPHSTGTKDDLAESSAAMAIFAATTAEAGDVSRLDK